MRCMFVLFVFAAIFASGCVTPADDVSDNASQELPEDSFCGASTGGTCSVDSDCATGGCSGQVCHSTSEQSPITTCEYRDCYDPTPYGVSCGCNDGVCSWTKKD